MIPGIVAAQRVVPASVAPSGDPHWANVQLLMSMDSNFNDESSFAKTPNAINGAVISSTQSAFGGASGFFDGVNDSVWYDHDTVYQVNQDFTFECWVYVDDLSKVRTIASKSATGSLREWKWQVLSNGAVQLTSYNTSGSTRKVITSPALGVAATTWTAVCVTGSGDTWRVFIDGVLVETASTAPSGTYGTAAQPLRFGAHRADDVFMSGYIDELRLTMGVCRYTASYTPSGPFPRGPV